MFNQKSSKMFESWPKLAQKVLDLVRKTVKDKTVLQLLGLADGADKGVYCLVSDHILYYLHLSSCSQCISHSLYDNIYKMAISTSVFFSILTRAEPELKCVKKMLTSMLHLSLNDVIIVTSLGNDNDVTINYRRLNGSYNVIYVNLFRISSLTTYRINYLRIVGLVRDKTNVCLWMPGGNRAPNIFAVFDVMPFNDRYSQLTLFQAMVSFVYFADTTELLALHLLPALLPSPMVRSTCPGDSSDRRRKRPWRPTIAEMMQACIFIVPVRINYYR